MLNKFLHYSPRTYFLRGYILAISPLRKLISWMHFVERVYCTFSDVLTGLQLMVWNSQVLMKDTNRDLSHLESRLVYLQNIMQPIILITP